MRIPIGPQSGKPLGDNDTFCAIMAHRVDVHYTINPLMYSAFAIELSDLSKPFKFARLKGFEKVRKLSDKRDL